MPAYPGSTILFYTLHYVRDIEKNNRALNNVFFGGGTRLSLDVLRELRLILRLMRFKRMDAEFHAIVAELGAPVIAMAAE